MTNVVESSPTNIIVVSENIAQVVTQGIQGPSGAGNGTVTSVAVATANGVSATVSNPTTAAIITILLGAITPSSINASGTVLGSNLSGTNTGDITLSGQNYISLSGQALTVSAVNLSGTNVTGNLPVTHLNSGTSASSTTFWRGDGAWATPAGGGTVSTVSVASANGFAGTVANPTSTPAITISTSITGILKGNGTAISQATLGTDYSSGTSALATGILKSTTTTGALTIAISSDFPILNQNTTGSAATLTTPRAINGVNFDGSAAITITAAAGTLTGTTLNSTVVSSSLTSVGTLTNLTVTNPINGSITGNAATVITNANLTGAITSIGNATSLGSFTSAQLATALTDETGTGANVFATSATLVTPILGTPQSGVLTNCTGTASGLTAGNVTTNANLTGPITSVGNATSIASQTGTGTTFAMSVSPTFTGTVNGAIAIWSSTNTAASFIPSGSSIPTNGIYLPFANTVGIASRSLAIAQFINPTSAVNYFLFEGASTGTNPFIQVSSLVDTNIGFDILPQGTGGVNLWSQNGIAIQSGTEGGTGTPVNYIQALNCGTGFNPSIMAAGSDTNIGWNFASKGTGSLFFNTRGTVVQFQVNDTASANHNITVTGSNGGAPTMSTNGGDLALSSNTGNIQSSASLTFTAATKGIVLKQGANGKCGTFIANGVTPVTVSNTSIAITDTIAISLNTAGGTVGTDPAVRTITAGSGFTVAGIALDTSTYNYVIISNAA